MTDTPLKEYKIKGMVCPRCITVVEETLEELGLEIRNVELGRARVVRDDEITDDMVDEALGQRGFTLLKGSKKELSESIKTALISYVEQLPRWDSAPKVSVYLSDSLHQNYPSLSTAFSEAEGITIEKFLIHLKIERVKVSLSKGDSTLSDIAFRLKYSSVSHLSNQFREVTGMSVTDYKRARKSFSKNA